MKLLGVEEVGAILGVKHSKAYAVIRQLNDELVSRGFLVIRGKVPESYLMERFYSE